MNIKQAIQAFKNYMASTDNPAQVTAAQLNMYSKVELNNILLDYLPAGSFGASKYGDNNWVPPNVLGSFEGGWRNENRAYVPMLQEPNGSYCILENATNGIKAGTYLTFLDIGPDGKTLKLNATPRRYEPPILQQFPGHRVFEVYNSEGKDVVWGKIINETTLEQKTFVALTGGTMDASGHVCTLLNLWDGAEQQDRAVLVKNRVYFIRTREAPSMRIFYVNVSDIVAGNQVTPVELTSWTTVGLNGVTRSGQVPQYATSLTSTNIDYDSVFWLESNVNSNNTTGIRNWTATHPTQNKLRLVLQLPMIAYWTGNTGYNNSSTIVMDIDFDASTVTVLPESRIKTKLNNSGSGAVQDPVSLAFNTKYGIPVTQTHDQCLITDKGNFLNVHFSNEGLGWWRYGEVGTGVELSNFDKLHPNNCNTIWYGNTNQMYRRFGSLMGGNTFIRAAFPNGEMLVYTTASVQDGVGKPDAGHMYAKVNAAYDGFVYKTDYGSLKGYKPTTSRTRVLGVAGGAVQTMLCTGANHAITKVGCAPMSGDKPSLSSPLEVTFDGSRVSDAGKGIYTLSSTALDAIKAKARTDYGNNFTTLTGLITNAELWIPPSGKRSYPAIVTVLMHSPTDLKAYWVTYQVSVTFSSGSITAGGTISSVTASKVLLTQASGNVLGLNWVDRASGQVYEHCDASGNLIYSAIYVPTTLNLTQPGSSWTLRPELGLAPTDVDYTTTYARYLQSYSWYFGYDNTFIVDTIGPVLIDFTRVKSAAGASIYYRKIQKDTLATYWGKTIDNSDGNYYVWLSAQVAEGYNIYFTDDTPCLINGFYYLVKSSSIDLTDIVADPSNKTFYVWLRLLNGVVSYVITPNQGDVYDLYIGKIVTNATQIDSINIVKTTVFNW